MFHKTTHQNRRWLLLLLAILVLPGCATLPPQASKPPEPPPPIPSHGGPKRVVINKNEQTLRAYDGDAMVFETRVSTGKEGKRTPNGRFRALGKEVMHYSSLYENSPMPYSVRFSGNYFIHGFSIVPTYPASHGCIRLPLRGENRNPARQFFDWVEVGTPIQVVGNWRD